MAIDSDPATMVRLLPALGAKIIKYDGDGVISDSAVLCAAMTLWCVVLFTILQNF